MKKNNKKEREEAQKFLIDVEQQMTSLQENFKQIQKKPEKNGGTLRNLLKTLDDISKDIVDEKESKPSVYKYLKDIRRRCFTAELNCHLFIADIETKLAS